MVPELLHSWMMAVVDDCGHVNASVEIVERLLNAIKMLIVLMNCDLVPSVILDLKLNVCILYVRIIEKCNRKRVTLVGTLIIKIST